MEQPIPMAEIPDMKPLKENLPSVEPPKDVEKVQEPVTSSDTDANLIEILSVDPDWDFCYVRFSDKKSKFEEFIKSIAEFYTEHHNDPNFAVDSAVVGQVYVILDTSGNWSRVMVKVIDFIKLKLCVLY